MGLRGVEAYLNVLRNREMVRLSKENLDAHVRTMDQINIRSTGGVGRKVRSGQSAARLGLALPISCLRKRIFAMPKSTSSVSSAPGRFSSSLLPLNPA